MMNRREWLAAAAAGPLAAATGRPNIVFLISDDHHWQCLGANGNPHIQTPNIDRLAARGVNFTNGLISTPQCAPSRGILLSGLESYQNGLDSNGHTSFRSFGHPTVVEQLRRSGYLTSLVGKWHISPTPKDCGFSQAPLWLKPASSVYQNPMLRRGLDGADEPVAGHITDLLTAAAVEAIRTAKQPHLLWLAYNAPHQPWYADERYRKLYAGRNPELVPPGHPKLPEGVRIRELEVPSGKKGGKASVIRQTRGGIFDWESYYAVITHLDEAVGKVVDAVEKSGQWDNTLIVFLGDNGYLCGTKGLQGKVYPWEESIRVPYIVSGGLVKKPGRSEAAVASVDLPATFLDYGQVRAPYALAGRSLRGAISGKKFEREASFSSWNDGRPEGLAILRSVEPYRVARMGTRKYIVWESKKEALFDLAADPGEENNLAADPRHATARASFRRTLSARMKETADPAAAWLS